MISSMNRREEEGRKGRFIHLICNIVDDDDAIGKVHVVDTGLLLPIRNRCCCEEKDSTRFMPIAIRTTMISNIEAHCFPFLDSDGIIVLSERTKSVRKYLLLERSSEIGGSGRAWKKRNTSRVTFERGREKDGNREKEARCKNDPSKIWRKNASQCVCNS